MPEAANKGQRKTNPWLIAVTVSMATFMEVMDTSIANVAPRHIAGSVGADQSESTWVLTSYLISNAIILPISGWIASVMGRKRFYMSCVALFTISSFLCGLAPNLSLLLFFRVMQGIGGGGLAPSEQSILADTFPLHQRGMAFAVYGVAVVVAPALGPALGGWITDTYSWRWIFFINIPVGILSLIMTYLLVHDSEGAKKEQQEATRGGIKVDYLGFAFIVIGFGSLQIVLDKGQEDDWFSSGFITVFAVLAAVGLLGMIFWELFGARDPMVDLPLFRDLNFLFTNIMMFFTLFVLLSTTQLLPQLVQDILSYNATKAGLLLMPGGLIIMALMPVAGILVKKIQPKYLICFGFLTIVGAMWNLAGFEAGASFKSLAVARMFQAVGFAFLFVPIQTLAYANLPSNKSNKGSALINLMRNLGGSVGISMVTTLLSRRAQIHQHDLAAHLTLTGPLFQQRTQALTDRFVAHGSDSVSAHQQALAVVSQGLHSQAIMISYIDVFVVLMIAALVAAGMTAFLKTIKLGKASAGH